MNTPVNFELAKLLKEKGFNLKIINFYNYEKLSLISDKNRQIDGLVNYNPINWNGIKDHYTSAPTIAEVVMWLYEKHGIWISVVCDCYGILWYANLSVASEKNWDNIDLRHEIISASKKFPNEHNSPAEAYEAAIRYVLSNLI